jgi:hypothetical protein
MQRSPLAIALQDRFHKRGLGRGPWRGEDAESAIGPVTEEVEAELRQILGRLEFEETLTWLCTELAASTDAQAQYRDRVAERPQLKPRLQQATDSALNGRILLQAHVSGDGRGTIALNRSAQQQVGSLGNSLRLIAGAADRVKYGLCSIDGLKLHPDGSIAMLPVDKPPFHLSALTRSWSERIGDTARLEPDAPLVGQFVEAVMDGGTLPTPFEDIDGGLRKARDHGLVALGTALRIVGLWASQNHSDSVVAGRGTRSDLEKVVEDNIPLNFPGVPTHEVIRALDSVIWARSSIQSEPIEFVNYRGANGRMYSRPLLELPDGRLCSVRGLPEAASLVLILRLIEGTWPERLTPADQPLSHALERRRNSVRPVHGFERDLEQLVREQGLPVAASVRPARRGAASAIGVPITSEIDVVAVDPSSRIIWVLEAKDLAQAASARRIRGEIDKYLRPGGYVDKLARKTAEVAIEPDAVAHRLGAPGTNYSVQGAFITREPSPAAFHSDIQFPFATIERVPHLLAQHLSSS